MNGSWCTSLILTLCLGFLDAFYLTFFHHLTFKLSHRHHHVQDQFASSSRGINRRRRLETRIVAPRVNTVRRHAMTPRDHRNTHTITMAFRQEPPFELIRVLGTTSTPSLAHLQRPHIAPATSPASRNNRTSNHTNTEGVPCMLTLKIIPIHFLFSFFSLVRIFQKIPRNIERIQRLSRSSTFLSESGNLTYSITASWIISGLVLK